VRVQDASVNSDARPLMDIIGERVARTQAKYHRWAKTDRTLRFGDLFNLVSRPDYLLVAWEHVAGNKGARTAGIDGVTVRQIVQRGEVGALLSGIAAGLRDGTYRPSPVRRVLIPKPGGKSRPLGIPTVADRVVQQSLRMVLEPIFEADFLPVSYGFRPKRRALSTTRSPRSTTTPRADTGGCWTQTSKDVSTTSTTRCSWTACGRGSRTRRPCVNDG